MKTGMGSMARPGFFERIFQFFGELSRRRVWRTALAYAAVVFVLLQLGEIVFPAFGAPAWSLRVLVVVCFLGFPVVLALAWAFDITPAGIQRAHSADPQSSHSDYSGTTLPRLALLAVIMLTVDGPGRPQGPAPGSVGISRWPCDSGIARGAPPPGPVPGRAPPRRLQ
jgi:uncharacterized membrane protein YhaH (DUF805 family)